MIQGVLLLILCICVLVGVAFFTLFERKLLGYIQLRKGPNKVGLSGILQPFADAIKLFNKEHVGPTQSNYAIFLLCPILSFMLALFGWVAVPFWFNSISFEFSILFFLCVLGMGVYGLLGSGWSSNSKYSLLGALRGVAQTISYEVSLVLILLSPVMLVMSFSFYEFLVCGEELVLFFLFPVSGIIWFISCLAETNRTPFDFAEGESELVSGYNTEFSAGGFALIMLAEYTSILFMSFLFGVLFFLGGSIVFFLFFGFVFVWVRGTLPRFRYDKLMYLAWKNFLPVSIALLVSSVGVSSLI